VIVAAACVTAVVGPAAWLAERRRIDAAIAERASLGIELLRARVRALAISTGDPWQGVVPKALASLAEEMPATALGRFSFAEVLDAEGRSLASAGDSSLAPPARTADLVAKPGGIGTARIHGSAVRGAVAVAALVRDARGERIARVNGVFLVSEATLAAAERRALLAVLGVVATVLATALVIYPLIRRLVRRLGGLSVQLLDANLDTLRVLGSAIAKRDSDTDAHNYRVTVYAVHLAQAIGLDHTAMRRLVKGAFLHDVGKIGIRDHILLKPGRLDEDEFKVMKTHVSHGLEIVSRSRWLRDAAEIIGGHHEQYAGRGYDVGLRGEEIPLVARIFAIADVFDALASERPYKKPITVEEAIAIIQEGAGRHFDPSLVARFSAIAPDLHARFAFNSEAAHTEVDSLVRRYFGIDLGVILEEAPAAS
jgi:HD-GYP domain-containing protein (c-di-GMP phosphodiesterase class II)